MSLQGLSRPVTLISYVVGSSKAHAPPEYDSPSVTGIRTPINRSEADCAFWLRPKLAFEQVSITPQAHGIGIFMLF